jgi:hypothetical protein
MSGMSERETNDETAMKGHEVLLQHVMNMNERHLLRKQSHIGIIAPCVVPDCTLAQGM